MRRTPTKVAAPTPAAIRCAIYTRKSTEEGLEQEFNTLDAQLAWARGEKEKSIQEWRRAVELEAKIQYDEPPAWFYPVRQSLAAALLRNGQAKEGEAAFRTAIEKRPRDGRLLFGLWQSLIAQKRDNEALLVEQQFNAAWKDATVTLRIEDL